MATHSSTLARRIPGNGEPGGLLSMGLQSRTRLKRLSSSSSNKFQTHRLKELPSRQEWLLDSQTNRLCNLEASATDSPRITTEPPGKPFLSPNQGSNPHPCSGSTES